MAAIATLNEKKPQPESLWQMTLRRFLRHRMAVAGALMLLSVIAFVIIGSFFFTEGYANRVSLDRSMYSLPPSSDFIFGTDPVGRDVFARVIYGGQISLMIGITAVTISVTLGTLVGLVAGYFGGLVDSLLMRFVEAMLSIPTLVLLLMLSRSLAGNTSTFNFLGRDISITVVGIVLIIGLTSWMGLSRIVRSLVLSLKNQEFVIAARTLGASDVRIVFVHILPNCVAPIIVTATLGIGGAIITETALSFLGFGVQQPTATWGNILDRARQQVDELWWLWLTPGFFIVITVLAINFLGDGLRDALDPRMRQN
ncbi:MAG: ABC transporter permease [Anaerolineae bacterium]|jgi:peptide/nickel transport system permease protein|nr:ABC transporter permease [Anaerolineae bacterium]